MIRVAYEITWKDDDPIEFIAGDYHETIVSLTQGQDFSVSYLVPDAEQCTRLQTLFSTERATSLTTKFIPWTTWVQDYAHMLESTIGLVGQSPHTMLNCDWRKF